MPFTDDDVNRLKEYRDKLLAIKLNTSATITTEKLVGLLARLEAAERVMRAEHNDDGGTISMCLQPCELCEAMKAYCKAAGK